MRVRGRRRRRERRKRGKEGEEKMKETYSLSREVELYFDFMRVFEWYIDIKRVKHRCL